MRIITPEILHQELSPVQCEAAININGPMLILAGAGSGKTRAIAYKIAHLISYHNVQARKIAAVTFTNKAAKEMKERIANILEVPNIWLEWMGTFHSLCVKILRVCLENPAVLNKMGWSYTKYFTIYDEDDQTRAIKSIVVPIEGDLANSARIKKIRAIISSWKNDRILPDEAMAQSIYEDQKVVANYYAEYQETLMRANAMDFDDLMVRATEILEAIPDVAEQFSSHFEYIFVDEYQDTNKSQYLLLQLLLSGGYHKEGEKRNNITVVGDDDQSIYGWRGADINIIRNFHRDFAPVQIVKLEENYRSTSNIVKAAGAVISNNNRPPEMEKNVFSNQPSGSLIHILQVIDDQTEAERIADKIYKLGSQNYSQTAIFYRTNAQSRLIEKSLNNRRIPNVIIGGTRFWDRKEVRDILAYMRLLANRQDNAALQRIVNVPPRKLGDKAMEQLKQNAEINDCSLFDALKHTPKFAAFANLMEGLLKEKEISIVLLAKKIIEDTKYKEYLEKDDFDSAADRISNVDEMLRGIEDFSEEHPDATLEEFLQDISLMTSADKKNETDKNFVTLMTLHSAKGLEFENVHIAGCDQGVLPMDAHSDLTESERKKYLEEERRLFYVGITRAKKNLFLYTTLQRFWRGESKMFSPTNFIEEMDQSAIFFEKLTEGSLAQNAARFGGLPFNLGLDRKFGKGRFYSPSSQGAKQPKKIYFEEQTNGRHLSYEDSQETHSSLVGKFAQHNKYGKGKVISQSGAGDNTAVEILFANGERRKFVLKFANLRFL